MVVKPGGTYLNPEHHVRYVLALCRGGMGSTRISRSTNLSSSTRAGAVLARAAGTRVLIYRFMFCNQIAVGFPPKPYALSA